VAPLNEEGGSFGEGEGRRKEMAEEVREGGAQAEQPQGSHHQVGGTVGAGRLSL